MLYLVATPIGNLGDITQRALDTLSSCDYILCEDTRHSRQLLSHFDIHKPLKSFHQHNEAAKEAEVLADLKNGLKIALISDAGTPGISDPGAELVKQCAAENIQIISIPGPCAAIVALTCSGLSTNRFQFFGFLPRKQGELVRTLQEILAYRGTTICYESPQRLLGVLEALLELTPEREVVVARELTKKFEEIHRGSVEEQLGYWQKEIKGEIVLLIAGQDKQLQDWEQLTPEQHVKMLEEEYYLSHRDAIKMASELRGVSKRVIYNQLQKDKHDSE